MGHVELVPDVHVLGRQQLGQALTCCLEGLHSGH